MADKPDPKDQEHDVKVVYNPNTGISRTSSAAKDELTETGTVASM